MIRANFEREIQKNAFESMPSLCLSKCQSNPLSFQDPSSLDELELELLDEEDELLDEDEELLPSYQSLSILDCVFCCPPGNRIKRYFAKVA